eukprot:GEMP01005313.1.p1 GENE.GEMP01005313.1~~GEMP01005313.1.p1  ORF type:complete len:843 (+),score=177.60 GEMP01005313.1:149-2677(+)
MGLLRSERMKCGTLVLPNETARNFVNILGANVSLQFLDMHAKEMVPTRSYRKYIQRIDEMERIVRFLFEEVGKLPNVQIHKNDIQGFLDTDAAYKLVEVEGQLKTLYKEFSQFKANNTVLIVERNAAIEDKYVAEFAAQKIFTSSGGPAGEQDSFDSSSRQALLEEGEKQSAVMFSHIAGVLQTEDQERFARFLFRSTRGNSYTSYQEIPEMLFDPSTGKRMRKSVFVVYFQDARGQRTESAMHQRIVRACKQFGVNTYPWMTSGEEARRRLLMLTQSAQEKERALQAFENFMGQEAVRLGARQPGGNSLLEEWRMFCLKEKSLYYTLNLFQGTTTLRCDVWYPEEDENDIRQLLMRASETSSSHQGSAMLVTEQMQDRKDAPTYFKSNDFIQPFMDLVFTYGVPRYGEASPVPLTVITFPFIFGIMYGDVGHGTLLFLVGCWLCWNAKKFKYSAPEAYLARYMVLMMGFFALYAGFLYNDFFSLGLDLFGSRWDCPEPTGVGAQVECRALYDINNGYCDPDNRGSGKPLNYTCPPDVIDVYANGGYQMAQYPFGVDPSWVGSSNELLFINSLKMKLSVIMGVFQMTVGLLLRFSNAVNERSATDFFCECIPMLVFMMCFFGWMDYMALYKWVTPLQTPPSIINSLICMAMGQTDTAPLWDGMLDMTAWFKFFAVLTIPWMLLPKPIILYFQHKRKSSPQGHVPLVDAQSGHDSHEVFQLDEIIIHQVIEVIEYVLGTVSHTASYLRQWALSLAHQQLSLVFFQKTLQGAFQSPYPTNAFTIFFAFAVWFAITLGVLLGMDVLECFLHTLRLHWVEFQSKFFRADGYLFEPFSHHRSLRASD